MSTLQFSTAGWYIMRVDTGIGVQHAPVQLEQESDTAGFSAHYKELVAGPAATAEVAWELFWKQLALF